MENCKNHTNSRYFSEWFEPASKIDSVNAELFVAVMREIEIYLDTAKEIDSKSLFEVTRTIKLKILPKHLHELLIEKILFIIENKYLWKMPEKSDFERLQNILKPEFRSFNELFETALKMGAVADSENLHQFNFNIWLQENRSWEAGNEIQYLQLLTKANWKQYLRDEKKSEIEKQKVFEVERRTWLAEGQDDSDNNNGGVNNRPSAIEQAPKKNDSENSVIPKNREQVSVNIFSNTNDRELKKDIKNNFNTLGIEVVYDYFKKGLVDKNHLTEQELLIFLSMAFDKQQSPATKLKFKNIKSEKGSITVLFGGFWGEIAGRRQGEKEKYVRLLTDYFEDFEPRTVSSNFTRPKNYSNKNH